MPDRDNELTTLVVEFWTKHPKMRLKEVLKELGLEKEFSNNVVRLREHGNKKEEN